MFNVGVFYQRFVYCQGIILCYNTYMTHNIKSKPLIGTIVPEVLNELDIKPTQFVAAVEAAGGSRSAAYKLTKGVARMHAETMLIVAQVLDSKVEELFWLIEG